MCLLQTICTCIFLPPIFPLNGISTAAVLSERSCDTFYRYQNAMAEGGVEAGNGIYYLRMKSFN